MVGYGSRRHTTIARVIWRKDALIITRRLRFYNHPRRSSLSGVRGDSDRRRRDGIGLNPDIATGHTLRMLRHGPGKVEYVTSGGVFFS